VGIHLQNIRKISVKDSLQRRRLIWLKCPEYSPKAIETEQISIAQLVELASQVENNDSHKKNRPMTGIGGAIGAKRSASMSARPLHGSRAILAALIAGFTSPAAAVDQGLPRRRRGG